jgi:Family of unknown function (DUF6629)
MCFSAAASFASGAVLIPAGAYCISAALRKRPADLTIAIVPMMFGIQQVSEGFVWHGLEHNEPAVVRQASLVFLFFALAFWPFWFAFSSAISDPRPRARLLFSGLATVASGWFCLMFLPLATGSESQLSVQVIHHSIYYDYAALPLAQSVPKNLLRAIYFLCVVLPMVFGSARLGRFYGVLFAAVTVFAAVVFHYAFVSVWCFFAALITVYLCRYFYLLKPEYREAAPANRMPVWN